MRSVINKIINGQEILYRGKNIGWTWEITDLFLHLPVTIGVRYFTYKCNIWQAKKISLLYFQLEKKRLRLSYVWQIRTTIMIQNYHGWPNRQLKTCKKSGQFEFLVGPECGLYFKISPLLFNIRVFTHLCLTSYPHRISLYG